MCKSSPMILQEQPAFSNNSKVFARRSLSFTRSSDKPLKTLSFLANAARTARIGISSTRVGTSCASIVVALLFGHF